MSIQFPFQPSSNGIATDGEIDSDGLVDVASGLGVQLGTSTVDYFDHSRLYSITRGSQIPLPDTQGPRVPGSRLRGSWYRDYSGPWDYDNHAQIARSNAAGEWLHDIVSHAGPMVGAGPYSKWGGASSAFKRTRPIVMVFLHGATSEPRLAPEEHIGTIEHFPRYWGFELVKATLGGGRSIRFLNGDRVGAEQWESSFGSTDDKDHILIPSSGSRRRPALSAMVTYRNGSMALATQAGHAIDQVYDRYTSVFGDGDDAPQIAFVGHSMGGLVARCLITATSSRLSGEQLTASQREKAVFLRDRTIFMATLATPHEGSPVADKVKSIAQKLKSDRPPWLKSLSSAFGLGDLRQPLRAFGLDRDAVRDCSRSSLRSWNRGPLHPKLGARSDGSLVPVYAISGRSPGGGYFDNPNLVEINPVNLALKKEAFNALGLVLIDEALHRLPGRSSGWGSPGRGTHDLDYVEQTNRADIAPLRTAGMKALLKYSGKLSGYPVAAGATQVVATAFELFMEHVPVYLRQPWEGTPIGDIAKCLHDTARLGCEAVMEIFKMAWNMTAKAAAKAAEAAGYVGKEISKALKSVYDLSTKAIGKILRQIGQSWVQVATALRRGLLMGLDAVAKLLAEIDASWTSVFKALKGAFSNSIGRLAKALSRAGATVLDVAKALKDALSASLSTIVKALKSASFGTFDIAGALRSMGHTALEVAKALKHAINASLLTIVKALKSAGFGILDVARAVRALHHTAFDVAKAMMSAGFSIGAIAAAVKSAFNLSVVALISLLTSLGISLSQATRIANR